ncbi:hypothetical protein CLAIMM_03272 [Cladophialophora immunda]|nr:hypothetical protein CLAIMM_03272 [Cladophialophora immunda]
MHGQRGLLRSAICLKRRGAELQDKPPQSSALIARRKVYCAFPVLSFKSLWQKQTRTAEHLPSVLGFSVNIQPRRQLTSSKPTSPAFFLPIFQTVPRQTFLQIFYDSASLHIL